MRTPVVVQSAFAGIELFHGRHPVVSTTLAPLAGESPS
jgi:hypothetical protein